MGSGKTLLKKRIVAVKRTYQINKQWALPKFKAAAKKSQHETQLGLPLPEVMTMISRGLMSIALAMLIKLAQGMMDWEVEELVGPKSRAPAERQLQRWSQQQGYCVVNGQKVPLQRPRVRDKQRKVPLGSYEALPQASILNEAIGRFQNLQIFPSLIFNTLPIIFPPTLNVPCHTFNEKARAICIQHEKNQKPPGRAAEDALPSRRLHTCIKVRE
jgi:hypothetical protein